MAQIVPDYCARCGVELVPNQKFCARCGLPVALQTASRAAFQSPEAAQGLENDRQQALKSDAIFKASRQPRWRIGRVGIVLALLLVLLLLGTASYLGLRTFGVFKATQSIVTTTSIDATLNYAGIDITITSAQRATSFIDDPNGTTDGMARLQLRAQNKTGEAIDLVYEKIALLILPGGKGVMPVYVKAEGSIAPGMMQMSSIDFPVPTDLKLDQLTFQLGATDEAQETVLLNEHADTTKYAARTIKPNKMLSSEYLGLNWTLISATTQLNLAGHQASKGMRYVIVTLKVDSTLAEKAIPGSAYDYIRLKVDSAVVTPINTTLPVAFDGGESGEIGTVTFLVSQSTTELTLILAAKSANGFDSATANFQF